MVGYNEAMDSEAVIACPECGVTTKATMPENACQRRFACPGCAAMLSPKPGDCCVFCSYSDATCPPRRAEDALAQTGKSRVAVGGALRD
jgi:hypothetical protein